MDILLISNEDMCRSRIAQELLQSFGRGMKITTAGISEGNAVPGLICTFMSQKGYEISRKKPAHISAYSAQHWDYIITLSKEAEEELKLLPIQTDNKTNLVFEDPFEDVSLNDGEKEEQLAALYEDMHKRLYEFYRDILSELLMPRCTCGANTYCRCE